MGVFKNTRDAFRRGADDNDTYEIVGEVLLCSHCGHVE